MKLLFNQNLSPKLADRLADLFPGSSHVEREGLSRAFDIEVWEFARRNGFAIVTKDEDFANLSLLKGQPPKVLWLQIGNCTTADVEELLRKRAGDIKRFEKDDSTGTMLLV